MKIIDLLNKIANGEEVPKEIFHQKQWWKYNPNNDYEGTEWGGCLLNSILINQLNDEVEIIEEDKKIEEPKIDFMKEDYTLEDIVHMTTINVGKLTDKICEIIDYINNKD